VFFIPPVNLNAQNTRISAILKERGEVVLKFVKPANYSLNRLSQIMSIASVKGDTITAYFNSSELNAFLKLSIPFQVEVKKQLYRSDNASSIWDWNKYPTYLQYIQMMDSFSHINPKICSIVEFGKSVKEKKLLFARINADTSKVKPSVMFTSTIHGDETGGYILMLRLAHYLITNYPKNELVKRLVDSLDIWINPLANPDGTYYSNTIFSAIRFNANNIDLNRNFPDFKVGGHPDGREYQPETKAMMNIMNQRHFVLSANFHSGSEVVNYPWDCDSSFHADKNWFELISKEYADSAQFYGRSKYFTDVDPKGYVDGIYWYVVNGGRQDYITHFHQGRETTIELDKNYITPESSLIDLWNYNYRSLLHYLEQGMYGIHGFMTDSTTGKPIKAKIKIIGHDDDNSFIYSDSISGAFFRPIYQGTYTLSVSALGYNTVVDSNINIKNRETIHLSYLLTPNGKKNIKNQSIVAYSCFPNPCKDYVTIECNYTENIKPTIEILDIQGKVKASILGTSSKTRLDIRNLATGYFIIRIVDERNTTILKLCKLN
jgi:hypothetical protein